MAVRHNACSNPACGSAVTGWSGGSVPAQAAGLTGFPRTVGARYTAGTFVQTPTAVAAPGVEITQSVYVLTEVFDDPSVDVYFFVTRSAGGDVQVGAIVNTNLVNNVVKRLEITRTTPANTTGCYMIMDSISMASSPTVFTALLTEAAPVADTYFDGTVPGAPTSAWDGTAELSASTLTDTPPAEMTLAGILPLMRAAGSIEASSALTLAGTLPLMRASGLITVPFDTPPMQWIIEQAAPVWRISQG